MATKSILSMLFSTALAQTTTISFPFIGFDDGTGLYGSIIAAQPSATTIALQCPPSTAYPGPEDCGLFPQQLFTYGPSTWHMDMSQPGDENFTATQDCSIGVSTAVCKESASGSEANFPGSSTETYEGTDGPTSFPVTITAGVEKLSGNTGAITTTAVMPTSTSRVSTSAITPTPTGAAAPIGNANMGVVGAGALGLLARVLL